ncbi:MAG: ribosomal RNA small subunit methyltransferase A [bacterium]|nr:ribosomal RNA small subunit methyltransferase A [bacterium]
MTEPGPGVGERAPRPPWSEFRAALDAAGFRPSRRLGQNFLLDENVARAIARDADPAPGELLLEIGPGCGFLSVHLAHSGARLVAVEIDTRLAPIARGFLAPYADAEVLEADVLDGKHRFSSAVEERLPDHGDWSVCSNLPYSVSGPVLALLAAREQPPRRVCVLVQKEVADRLGAPAGSAARGPLSVRVQSAFAVRTLRAVAPQLFWPRPKVDSSVVLLERRPDLPSCAERRRIAAAAGLVFRHRRKGLARILSDHLGDRSRALTLLERLGIEPSRRPQTLEMGEIELLAQGMEIPD